MTAVVQVQGKVKARLEVAPDISDADLEAAGAGRPRRAAGDRRREVRKVIVRAPKLVNIVAG